MCFSACVSFCTHFASSLYELLYGAPCHRGWMVLQLLHMWVCAVCGSLYNPPFSSLLVAGSGGGHTMLDANLFLGEGLSSYDYVKSHHVARAGTLHFLRFRSADSVELKPPLSFSVVKKCQELKIKASISRCTDVIVLQNSGSYSTKTAGVSRSGTPNV